MSSTCADPRASIAGAFTGDALSGAVAGAVAGDALSGAGSVDDPGRTSDPGGVAASSWGKSIGVQRVRAGGFQKLKSLKTEN